MGIKTEDMVKNLPPKEMTAGIDWMRPMAYAHRSRSDRRCCFWWQFFG